MPMKLLKFSSVNHVQLFLNIVFNFTLSKNLTDWIAFWNFLLCKRPNQYFQYLPFFF